MKEIKPKKAQLFEDLKAIVIKPVPGYEIIVEYKHILEKGKEVLAIDLWLRHVDYGIIRYLIGETVNIKPNDKKAIYNFAMDYLDFELVRAIEIYQELHE